VCDCDFVLTLVGRISTEFVLGLNIRCRQAGSRLCGASKPPNVC
jgi:hypothetical protein